MAMLKISEAAAKTGLSAHTVRYYESAGLIPPVPRDEAGRRVFDEEAMAWLEYSSCLRSLGMPVRQVASYVRNASSGATDDESRERIRDHLDMMRSRRDELDVYIGLVEAKLDAMRRKDPR